jgi:hypothetical protein
MDISVKTSNSKLKSKVQIIEQKTTSNKHEPKITLEVKVYIEMYYSH